MVGRNHKPASGIMLGNMFGKRRLVTIKPPTVAWVVQLNNGEKITGGPSWRSMDIHASAVGNKSDWARLMDRCKEDARLRVEKLSLVVNGLQEAAPPNRGAYGYFESYEGHMQATFKGARPMGAPTCSPTLKSLGICYTNTDDRGLHVRVHRYVIDLRTGNATELEFIRRVQWLPCLIGEQDEEFDRARISGIAPRRKR